LKNRIIKEDVLTDFVSLFFPINCVCCQTTLFKHEHSVCNLCYVNLPRFDNAYHSTNLLEKMLEGRVKFKRAFSLFNYQKESKVQQLLHQLKYKNQPEIGNYIGEWMASELKCNDLINADLILPIPLHPKKEKIRGYNQSDKIAMGFGNKLGLRVDNKVLFRKVFTNTQTKKGKNERWENVKDVFGILPDSIKPKSKIVLVDDVITTGSTIEACTAILNEITDIELYIVSAAFACVN
jgi:ComF family protein